MAFFYLLGIVLIVLFFFTFSPLAFIWAINELFGLGIAYTFWTWLASFVLLICLNASITKR